MNQLLASSNPANAIIYYFLDLGRKFDIFI